MLPNSGRHDVAATTRISVAASRRRCGGAGPVCLLRIELAHGAGCLNIRQVAGSACRTPCGHSSSTACPDGVHLQLHPPGSGLRCSAFGSRNTRPYGSPSARAPAHSTYFINTTTCITCTVPIAGSEERWAGAGSALPDSEGRSSGSPGLRFGSSSCGCAFGGGDALVDERSASTYAATTTVRQDNIGRPRSPGSPPPERPWPRTNDWLTRGQVVGVELQRTVSGFSCRRRVSPRMRPILVARRRTGSKASASGAATSAPARSRGKLVHARGHGRQPGRNCS